MCYNDYENAPRGATPNQRFGDNIESLAQAMTANTNFYKDYIHYTAENVNYRLYVQIDKINDHIMYMEMADLDEALAALEN